MALHIRIEQDDDVRTLRVLGPTRLNDVVSGLREPIADTRRDRVARLLIVVEELLGDAPPDLGERHRLVREWCALADNRTRVAMVVPPVLIDEERFGVVAAANFGFRSSVFANESEALAWLRRDD